MAARLQALAAVVVEQYDGDAERLWQEADSGREQAAGHYAEPGAHRSVSDVVDQASLDAVRAFKKEKKRAAVEA